MRLLLIILLFFTQSSSWIPSLLQESLSRGGGNLVFSLTPNRTPNLQTSFYSTCRKRALDRRKESKPLTTYNRRNLELYEFGQDDLPNLFGVNPIEATVLFTFAYYVLGPEKLYEYAREAGRLFSTYFPIVQQAVTDIVYEFRDYLEEDRERSSLSKAGIDISILPRKTTNLFARMQKSLEVRIL